MNLEIMNIFHWIKPENCSIDNLYKLVKMIKDSDKINDSKKLCSTTLKGT
jgi:hypothetical protein